MLAGSSERLSKLSRRGDTGEVRDQTARLLAAPPLARAASERRMRDAAKRPVEEGATIIAEQATHPSQPTILPMPESERAAAPLWNAAAASAGDDGLQISTPRTQQQHHSAAAGVRRTSIRKHQEDSWLFEDKEPTPRERHVSIMGDGEIYARYRSIFKDNYRHLEILWLFIDRYRNNDGRIMNVDNFSPKIHHRHGLKWQWGHDHGAHLCAHVCMRAC